MRTLLHLSSSFGDHCGFIAFGKFLVTCELRCWLFILLDLEFRERGDVVIKRSFLSGPLEDWTRAICKFGRLLTCYHVAR
jgi:hypothetical protein